MIMNKVDIILPVYNAYEYTKTCLASVVANTNLKFHTLVIINDKSPDERILPMLQDFVESHKQDSNIVLINNKENLGFVRTVNVGMRHSSNDVVLLNSDTEVTSGWLEKMQTCAYSKPMVASVTPLSNNATIASVPVYLAENKLPQGFSLEQYAKEIEQCSQKLYPELCTGHGFCMYITRQAINHVGLFDEETFGLGYGEENDFSYRAMQHGYVHLLADDTFVYHKGTQSFSPSSVSKAANHLNILRKRYPQETHNTDVFVRDNPLLFIQENIQQNVINRKRPNILFFIHDFRGKEYKNIGGTTIHVYDLIDNLTDEANIHVFYRDVIKGVYAVKSYYGEYEKTLFLGDIQKMSSNALFNQDFKRLVSKVFAWLRIDIIHVHHTKDLYWDLFDEAFKQNIPVLYTFHDFYSLCPSVHLLTKDKKRCDGIVSHLCDNCYYNSQDIKNWQKEISIRLKKCQKLYAPTESARRVITNAFPKLSVTVREHGYEIPVIQEVPLEKQKTKSFNIAFVGGIADIKGLDYLKGIQKAIRGSDIQMHLFGTTSSFYYNSNQENYCYHGAYERKELPSLLTQQNIKLVMMLSVVKETYSYTLSESIACGIPVLAFDLGAVGERVKRGDIGFLLPPESSVAAVVKEIHRIKNTPEEYNSKVENIQKALKNVKSIRAMSFEYLQDYKDIMANSPVSHDSKHFTMEMMFGMMSAQSYEQDNYQNFFQRTKDVIKFGSRQDAKQVLKEYCSGDNPAPLKRKLKRKYFWYQVLGVGRKSRS